MSTKRQPAKQRRQTVNQRQRAALEARRANAAATPVPEGKVGGSGSSTGGSGSGAGSLFSRLRGAQATGRGIRTGGTATGAAPGYRAALSGLLAGVAAAVVGALLISIPVDASGDPIASSGAMAGEWTLSALDALQDDPGATADELVDAVEDWTPNGEEPYGKAYFPLSLGLLLPILGAALAFRSVAKRAPAKVVNRTMYVTLFGTLLNAQLLFLFLPTVIGIGIAAFQVRKADLAALAEAGGDDGVIEVDEVELDDAIDEEEGIESDQLIEAEAIADEEPDQRKV